MNELLSLAGSLLYVLVNIIIFPLMIVLDCILGLVTLARHVNTYTKRMRRNVLRQKQSAYNYLLKKQFVIYRKQPLG